MGKTWKRKVKENGGALEVKPDHNPPGRNDPANEITVFIDDDDLPADIEWSVQGNLTFVGPAPDENGNSSVIWKTGSDTLPWILDGDKKLTIQDDVNEVKDFNYRIGAYDKDGNWLLTPDPEIRNKKRP
jgi:hypothetical protein